jgi:hypothetical protein
VYANDEVFAHACLLVVGPFLMQIDRAGAPRRLRDQFRRTLDVVLVSDLRATAALGEHAQREIGLGFALLAEDDGRIVEEFGAGGLALIETESQAQFDVVQRVASP